MDYTIFSCFKISNIIQNYDNNKISNKYKKKFKYKLGIYYDLKFNFVIFKKRILNSLNNNLSKISHLSLYIN